MSIALGSLAIAVGTDTSFSGPSDGCKAILIGNASGITVIVTMESGGVQKTLYPGVLDWFTINPGFTGNIKIHPISILNNISSWPSSSLLFDAIGLHDSESSSQYPMQLSSPAVTATASGSPLFSATFGIGTSAGQRQAVNVFNPPTSGVAYTFHSAKAFSSSTTVTSTFNLVYAVGPDLNLSVGIPAASHAGTGSAPVSTAHCSAMDQNGAVTQTTLIEQEQVVASTQVDLLTFPDNYTLAPGGNLRLEVRDVATSHTVRVTLKWTEAVVTPIAGGLPLSIATSVINVGNGAGTPVVQGIPSGDFGVPLLITNDGKLTLGSTLNPGSVSLDNAKITSDGSGNLTIQNLVSKGTASLDNGNITTSGAGVLTSKGLTLSAGTVNLLGSTSVSRLSIFGPIAVTTTLTAFNHNLGAIPDVVMLTIDGTTTSAPTVKYDSTSMTTTQVKCIASAALNAWGIAIKK